MRGKHILLATVAAAICITTTYAKRQVISSWKQIDTKKLKLVDVSVVSKNNIWGLDKKGRAYQWDGQTWTEKLHSVPFKEMSVGTDGTVFMVDAKSRIFTDNPAKQVILQLDLSARPQEPVVSKAPKSKELVQIKERKRVKKCSKKDRKEIAAVKDLLKTLEKQLAFLTTQKGSVQKKIKKLQVKREQATGFMKAPIQAALDAQINTLSTNHIKPIDERLAFIKEEINKQKNQLAQIEG